MTYTPRNMMMDTIDPLRASPDLSCSGATTWLKQELDQQYGGVAGPPKAWFYTDGLEVFDEQSQQTWLRSKVVYVVLAYGCRPSNPTKEHDQAWAMAKQLLYDIQASKPEGRLVWRMTPQFERQDPAPKTKHWSGDPGGIRIYMRLAFTGAFSFSATRCVKPEGQPPTRYDE